MNSVPLHIDPPKRDQKRSSTESACKQKPTVFFYSVSQLRNHHQVLLMMRCVQVVGYNGSTSQARTLSDLASSALFITEHLAQHHHSLNVSTISTTSLQLSSHRVVNFSITNPDHNGRVLSVEAWTLFKITSNLPLHPVPLDSKWKHLAGLSLADPDLGIPGNKDLLLGVNVFSCAALCGRQFGPSGSPSAFKTHFGWVLAGVVHGEHHRPGSSNLC